MKPLKSFPFFFQSFLADTAHMNSQQVGIFIQLLCHQANRGAIRVTHFRDACGEDYDCLSEMFICDDDGFYNEDLRGSIDKKQQYSKSRSDNRKKKPQKQGLLIDVSPKKVTRMSKPTIEEVTALFKTKGFEAEAVGFYNFYESNGWRVGKNPMKKWAAAAANWIRSNTNGNTDRGFAKKVYGIVPEKGKYKDLHKM